MTAIELVSVIKHYHVNADEATLRNLKYFFAVVKFYLLNDSTRRCLDSLWNFSRLQVCVETVQATCQLYKEKANTSVAISHLLKAMSIYSLQRDRLQSTGY